MEKAKIGVSVGALAAMVYFSGICGGLLVAAVLTGYILIAESNLWLRRSAVKAIVLMIVFSVINIIVNLLPDGISAIESLAGMFRLSMNEFVVSNLALFITKVFDIIKNLLFLALGMSALKQRTIVIAPIERLIDKCMGMM